MKINSITDKVNAWRQNEGNAPKVERQPATTSAGGESPAVAPAADNTDSPPPAKQGTPKASGAGGKRGGKF